eukprot:CAMPEP_0171017416 /NCGR_PEP_ID=MMETSP0736-20130129/27415_1 /TAXON_ID=186038 /ORGANISM="Fragilariopsis kerguelensis, Strain L26-C5" /LENGTH=50 /DNA_ID=CAMNT_0011453239 /DNA_START=450 /DNA_END=602 /DNA_ORIENTATION=-
MAMTMIIQWRERLVRKEESLLLWLIQNGKTNRHNKLGTSTEFISNMTMNE